MALLLSVLFGVEAMAHGPVLIGELPFGWAKEEDTLLQHLEMPYISSIVPDERLASSLRSLPESAYLAMDYIDQNPELPTGCESVALTMALNSLGFHLSKTTIAEQYLIYSEDDLAQGYNGDPFEEDGAGVFPPGVVLTANNFLSSQGATVRAYEASDATFEQLLAFLSVGNPVLLWVTMEYDEPWWGEDYGEFNGIYYQWYWNEHCVALEGYDLNEETVTIFDPLNGILTMDLYEIEELSAELGGLAVVLR